MQAVGTDGVATKAYRLGHLVTRTSLSIRRLAWDPVKGDGVDFSRIDTYTPTFYSFYSVIPPESPSCTFARYNDDEVLSTTFIRSDEPAEPGGVDIDKDKVEEDNEMLPSINVTLRHITYAKHMLSYTQKHRCNLLIQLTHMWKACAYALSKHMQISGIT